MSTKKFVAKKKIQEQILKEKKVGLSGKVREIISKRFKSSHLSKNKKKGDS